MYAKTLITVAAAAAAVCASACTSVASAESAQSATDATPSGGAAVPPSLRVLSEPKDGIGAIYRAITGARSSVDLTMYELADKKAEADLGAAANRGVTVRVLLDRRYEKSANRAAYNYLSAHGVHVRWGPSGTTFHQKTLTVDNATSVIMTLNLTSRYYPDTRDFAVIDTNHSDVAAIVKTFNADFAAHSISRSEIGRAHV